MTEIEATQWAGCAAFGLAALSCGVWGAKPYPLAAIANGLFTLECILGLRHKIRSAVIIEMGSYYPGRTPVQVALILLAIAALLFLLLTVKGSKRQNPATDRPAGFAGTLTLMAAFVFLVETISLHSVDRILYQPIGNLLAIGWVWIFLGGMTVLSAAGVIRR